MIIPSTYWAALVLLTISLVCWGSWANTLKLTGTRWRFELFYFDYSIGVLLASIIGALTFGSLGSELTFSDRLLVSSRTSQALVFAGGLIFNLANMLLVAAISLVGLSVAFPVGIGLALIIGVIWNYFVSPLGNPFLLFGGVIILIIAILVDARAYRESDRAKTAGKRVAKKGGKRTTKGILISLIAGVLMGTFYPLVAKGMSGDLGLGPYAAMVIFGVAVFLSTLVYNFYFMNLPLEGDRIQLSSYFRGTLRNHGLGILGGAIWATGALTNFLAASTPAEVNVGPAVSLAMGQGATLVSVLWGLLVWKEFDLSNKRLRNMLASMIALFAIGLTVLSLAPLVR